MTRTPTLEDVAQRAGVSTATVSRCLNAPEKVVEATRLRVLEAVEALGYAPNFSAQALAAKRTRTIGAIIPTMENAIFAEGIQAFQETLHAEGYTLLIASTGYDPAVEAEAIRTLAARGAEGLLLIGYDRDPSIAKFLQAQDLSVIVSWAFEEGRFPSAVGFDNRAAMKSLVQHALDLGHRNVVMISAKTCGNDRARARCDGALDALGARGLSPLQMVETEYSVAKGEAAFDTLVMAHPEATLFVCGNDVLAAGAIRAAERRGIRVPEEVSITGFDDIGLASLVRPSLTTVRVPHRAMGQAAARSILSLVEGLPTESRALPTELCLRDSLAVPRR
jgi:LacI family transcriptional regulator